MGRKKDEYVIIVGCGRLGGYLAGMLSGEGKSVVVVDRDPSAFKKLGSDFSGFAVEADATETDTLRNAKIEKADVLVTTTNDDNTNIMIAQIAKQIHGVPKVIARLYELQRQKVYEELGIQTICPTILSAEAFEKIINEDGTEG